MIDISIRRENPYRAIAYFDGADARVYRAIVSRLRSEDAAQNAVILVGLIAKLGKLQTKKAVEEIERIQKLFPRLVGISYKKFDAMLDDI